MATRPGSVIIVDDDDAVRSSLKFVLELEGLDVQAYQGGREVLADAAALPADCLVVDYFMPAMTGIELIDELHRRLVHIPAILITARADADMRGQAARAGFHAVLEKPLSDEALIDTIRSLLPADRTGAPG
ncbi:response regulator transcription factor [Geminicoccus roseus]|uniref:response regulator transcription factor n=1 Tax=Geminicoccus roseus TaxID=404900 RepID=UPI00041DE6CE|nr:response regulator [Geminicoccus roseus]